MRILLISLMLSLLLVGCANQRGNGGTTSKGTSSTSSSTTTSTYHEDLSTMRGMMDYLRVNGLKYEDEMDIAQLEPGFEEGRKFSSNGVSYGLFRYNEQNQDFSKTLEEAKSSGYISMKVNGKVEKVPVHVYKNYLLVYPEGTDLSDMMNYFR